ncbi:tetratricopeptide repeat protein, partial [candidate division GN15 bacterium]|nr:tetratricopeptide repeat protein [candidate division GN15 bacterium]
GLGDICSSRRDYQQAVNYYRRAVKLMPSDFSARVKLIGALYRSGRQQEFITELKQALESRPRDEQAYVQVVRMLIGCGDMDGARNIHSQGLQNAKTTDSLELMADQLNQDPSISVCMIVKNEEEMLPECLDSVRDWADEIVVVDTGSEDRTIEIAESYRARIFHQPWEGDFSKHRNYSIEQATCDWIFIIDADERFEPEGVEMLKRTMNNPNINVISINVFNVYGDKHDVKTFLPSVRAWRRELGLKYEGIVHNALALGEHPVYRLPVNLRHLGYDLSEEKMRQKHERTKTLLERQLEEDPDNVFALFNYSQVLRTYNGRFAIENIPTILETSERAVRLSDPTNKRQRHLHLMCLEQIAASYFHQKEYEKAIEYCDRALELKPDYLDPLMIRANCLYRLGEGEKASEAYLRYLEAQAAYDPGRETDPIILGHVDGRAPAQYSLASIAYDSGDLEAARYHFEEALRVRDGFKDAYARIGQIYYDDGDFDQARRHFLKQLETGKKTVNTLLGLALIYKQTGMSENAEEYFREALELEAFNSEVKAKYGRFLLEQDRVDEARNMIEDAIKHDKDKLNSLRWAGQLYTEFGQHELSADCFARILETFGDDPDSLNDQANCYYQQKEFEKAVKLYQRAVELASVKPVTWRNMGLALFQLNRCEEAISSLETYLEQCPHDLDVVHVAGDLYSKTGQFDKALNKYEIYLSKNPVDTLAMFNLSECYLNMGHIDSAVMGYKRVLQIDPEFKPASDRLSQVLEPANQT